MHQIEETDLFVGRKNELTILTKFWSDVKGGDGPRLAMLIGESGIGKTRIAQEFYSKLCEHDDAESYWPEKLYEVNPEFTESEKNLNIPFLWWGISFGGYGKAIDAHLFSITKHLEPMYQARIRRSLGSSASWMIVESAATIADGVFTGGAASLAYGAIANSGSLYGASKAMVNARKVAAKNKVKGIVTYSDEEYNEKILSDFRCVFDTPNKDLIGKLKNLIKKDSPLDFKTIPMVLFLDRCELVDQSSIQFLEKFISEAVNKKWPVLFISTYRSKQWEEDWRDKKGFLALDLGGNETDSNVESFISLLPVIPLLENDTSSYLKDKFKGLTKEQLNLLVTKVGGNALLLRELERCLYRHKKWFVNSDINSSMTSAGVSEVRQQRFSLHNLIRKRIESEGELCGDMIGLASFQGYQFIHKLALEIAGRIDKSVNIDHAEASLSKGISPLSIVRKLNAPINEFSHTAYYEVAKDLLSEFEKAYGNPSVVIATILIEWMAVENRSDGSKLENELLANLTFEYVHINESDVLEHRILASLARTKARVYKLNNQTSRSNLEAYLEEFGGLISYLPSINSSLLEKTLLSAEEVISPLLSTWLKSNDELPHREQACKLYSKIVDQYLVLLNLDQASSMLVRFSKAIHNYSIILKIVEEKSFPYEYDEETQEIRVYENPSIQKTAILFSKEANKKIDYFLRKLKVIGGNFPKHIILGYEALLLKAKSDLIINESKNSNLQRKLLEASMACLHNPTPDEMLIRIIQTTYSSVIMGRLNLSHQFCFETFKQGILQSTVSNQNPNVDVLRSALRNGTFTQDDCQKSLSITDSFNQDILQNTFCNEVIRYLESKRSTQLWDDRLRSMYYQCLRSSGVEKTDEKYLVNREKIVQFGFEEIERHGSSVLKGDFYLLPAIEDIITDRITLSNDYEPVLNDVKKLIGNTFKVLQKRSEYYPIFCIVEKIIVSIATNFMEQFNFSKPFIEDITRDVIHVLEIPDEIFSDKSINMETFHKRCLWQFLLSYSRSTWFFEDRIKDTVKTFAILVDLIASDDINVIIRNRREWNGVKNAFGFFAKIAITRNHGKAMLETVIEKIEESILAVENEVNNELTNTKRSALDALRLTINQSA